MKLKIFFTCLLVLLSINFVSAATCTVGGEEVPCDGLFGGIGIAFIIMFLFGMLLSLAGFIFWIFMLVDCAKRNFKDKVVWVIILVFTGVLGALIYYFVVKRK